MVSERICITIKDVPALRKAYDNCPDETFEFKGNPVYKPYAKYLLEYLEGLMKEKKCQNTNN